MTHGLFEQQPGAAEVNVEAQPSEPVLRSIMSEIARLLFVQTGLYERWKNELEARNHVSPERGPVDYARRPLVHIRNYREGPRPWQKSVMMMVVAVVVIGIPVLISTLYSINSHLALIEKSLSRNPMQKESSGIPVNQTPEPRDRTLP